MAAPAPAAPITTIKMSGVADLLSKARGRVAVVNLWATWCPPCVAEMPHFIRLHERYGKGQTALISLSADAPDTVSSVVQPFREKHQMPFAVHVLEERDPDALARVLHADLSGALPVTLIYDRHGKLAKIWEGVVTFQELQSAIEPLL